MMFKTKIISSRIVEAFRAKLNNRGESIMEVLVSFMIFAILLTTAVAIVRSALVITGERIALATEAQTDANDLVRNYDLLTVYGYEIVFSMDSIIVGGLGVDASHDIVLNDDNDYDFVVFRPEP